MTDEARNKEIAKLKKEIQDRKDKINRLRAEKNGPTDTHVVYRESKGS